MIILSSILSSFIVSLGTTRWNDLYFERISYPQCHDEYQSIESDTSLGTVVIVNSIHKQSTAPITNHIHYKMGRISIVATH